MNYTLLRLAPDQLTQIAARQTPSEFAEQMEHGALPPAFVAARALRLLGEGVAEVWASTYLIVRRPDGRIVGGCGFKFAPEGGRVEIGYGVAPQAEGRGAATAAVGLLVALAFSAGATQVVAEVAPANLASRRVVEKAGFAVVGARVDVDGEHLLQWALAA